MSLVKLYKDEEGQGIAITMKDTSGTDFATDWIVLGDTTIVIKPRDLSETSLTVTSTDLANSTPTITWTPTTAQIGTSLGVGYFRAFVHLRNDSTPREVIGEFDLEIVNN